MYIVGGFLGYQWADFHCAFEMTFLCEYEVNSQVAWRKKRIIDKVKSDNTLENEVEVDKDNIDIKSEYLKFQNRTQDFMNEISDHISFFTKETETTTATASPAVETVPTPESSNQLVFVPDEEGERLLFVLNHMNERNKVKMTEKAQRVTTTRTTEAPDEIQDNSINKLVFKPKPTMPALRPSGMIQHRNTVLISNPETLTAPTSSSVNRIQSPFSSPLAHFLSRPNFTVTSAAMRITGNDQTPKPFLWRFTTKPTPMARWPTPRRTTTTTRRPFPTRTTTTRPTTKAEEQWSIFNMIKDRITLG